MLLVILGSALDVLLNICVGISLLVRVVKQYVVGVRFRVVRGDDAVVGAVSCEVLADLCVDKCISCCAIGFVIVVALVSRLFSALKVVGARRTLSTRALSMGGAGGAGTICSSSLSESVSSGRESSVSVDMCAGAVSSGSKSDSSELSASSSVWGRSVFICGTSKSLIAACGFGVVRLWNVCQAGGAVALSLKGYRYGSNAMWCLVHDTLVPSVMQYPRVFL